MLTLPRLTLLDLDGTLVDTASDLHHSVNAMLLQLGRPACAEADVRRWVGNGIERLVHRALTGIMEGQAELGLFEQAKHCFEHFYADANGRYSQIYPGVIEGLEYLQQHGSILVCITNKRALFSKPLLHALGLATHFQLVLSGDSLARQKPDPLPLLHAAKTFDIEPQNCLMIGDSVNDVAAARAAGFAVVGVSYGYNHGQPIALATPDVIVDSLAQLPLCFNNVITDCR